MFGLFLIVVIVVLGYAVFQNYRKLARAEEAQRAEAFDKACLYVLYNRLSFDEVQKLSLLAGRYMDRLVLISTLKQLRESIDLALGSMNRDTATSRMEFAENCVQEIDNADPFAASPHILDEIHVALTEAQNKFKTVVHVNASRGHAAKAASLKTDKAKRKHLHFAREEIQLGLTAGQGDLAVLKAELAAIDAKIAEVGVLERPNAVGRGSAPNAGEQLGER